MGGLPFELRPSKSGRPQTFVPIPARALSEEIHHTCMALSSRCFFGKMAERNAIMFLDRFGSYHALILDAGEH